VNNISITGTPALTIEIKPGDALSKDERESIINLCSDAFEELYEPYLQVFKEPTHILLKLEGTLVSHALWITRWLQVEDCPLMQTAYVEGVATEGRHRNRGYATLVMQCLAAQIQGWEIGALSPAETSLYARVGWEYWQGPLYARKEGKLIPVPGESAMILRIPRTPILDLYAPISIEWREGDVW